MSDVSPQPSRPFPGASDDTGVIGSLSRRNFLKSLGTTVVASAVSQAKTVAQEIEKLNAEKVHGPGAVPITLKINGESHALELEPRVTLLDALRNHTPLTGSKEVCDRASCGACTVLVDGMPTYSCMKLAIEAQGHEITTVEGLAKNGELTAVQKAFIHCDGMQCGYCTPGFVMSITALLQRNPKPNEEEVHKACSGNLCRCGTYPRVFAAALEAAGVKTESKAQTIRPTPDDVRLA
jgi:xanthine dehydrogenase YagT iron-sulfur-binding subunit